MTSGCLRRGALTLCRRRARTVSSVDPMPRRRASGRVRPCAPDSGRVRPCAPDSGRTRPCAPDSGRTRPCTPDSGRTRPCAPDCGRTRPCAPDSGRVRPCAPDCGRVRPRAPDFGRARPSRRGPLGRRGLRVWLVGTRAGPQALCSTHCELPLTWRNCRPPTSVRGRCPSTCRAVRCLVRPSRPRKVGVSRRGSRTSRLLARRPLAPRPVARWRDMCGTFQQRSNIMDLASPLIGRAPFCPAIGHAPWGQLQGKRP